MRGGLFKQIISSFAALTVVFIVLSGFGITSGYLKKLQGCAIDLEGFYFRRYKKIWPFFFITTIIGVIFERSIQGVEEGIMELTLLYGFLPNNCNSFSVNGVCWTLGTIFAFYILYPYISVFLKNRNRAWGALICSIVVMFLSEHLFLTEVFVRTPYLNRSNVLFSLPFFLSGCMLSIYQNEIAAFVKQKKLICTAACVLLTCLLLFSQNEFQNVQLADYKYWALGVLWIGYTLGVDGRFFTNKIIYIISKYSMEIYLSHMIIRKVLGYLQLSRHIGDNLLTFVGELFILMCGTLLFAKIVDMFLNLIYKRIKQ